MKVTSNLPRGLVDEIFTGRSLDCDVNVPRICCTARTINSRWCSESTLSCTLVFQLSYVVSSVPPPTFPPEQTATEWEQRTPS